MNGVSPQNEVLLQKMKRDLESMKDRVEAIMARTPRSVDNDDRDQLEQLDRQLAAAIKTAVHFT